MARRKWTPKLHPRIKKGTVGAGRFMSKLVDVDPGLMGSWEGDMDERGGEHPVEYVRNAWPIESRKGGDKVPVFDNPEVFLETGEKHEFLWGTVDREIDVELYWPAEDGRSASLADVAAEADIDQRVFVPGRDPDFVQGSWEPDLEMLVVWEGEPYGANVRQYPTPDTLRKLRDRYPDANEVMYNGGVVPNMSPEQYAKFMEGHEKRRDRRIAMKEAENAFDPMAKYYKAQDFIEEDYPKFKDMDSQSLIVEDYARSGLVDGQIKGLSMVPDNLFRKWAKNSGHTVFLGDRPMSELDDNARYATSRPFEGGTAAVDPHATYDDMAGVFSGKLDPNSGQITVGNNGGAHTVLHEFGHSFDHWQTLTGMDDEGEGGFKDAHIRLYPKLRPYIRQRGPGSDRGVQELFADGFADIVMNEDSARRKYDDEFVDQVKEMIRYVEQDLDEDGMYIG